MGLIYCSETSLRNYHYSLRNNPEERSSRLISSGSLKSSTYFYIIFRGVQIPAASSPIRLRLICCGSEYGTCFMSFWRIEFRGGFRTFEIFAYLLLLLLLLLLILLPIPTVARSKASVYGRSLAGIVGSNPAGGMDVSVSCECCVLSGRGLCVGLITRPGESYQVQCF